MLVRILVAEPDAIVRSPFAAKDVIKSMPVRRWDPDQKAWVIPAGDVPELKTALEAAGFRVLITEGPKREKQQRQERRYEPPPRNTHSANGKSWAESMFLALNPALAEKAYKQLIRVLHPDAGGSEDAMKILNVARDRWGRH